MGLGPGSFFFGIHGFWMILPFCLINHFNHVHRFWRSVFDHRNLVRLSFGIHHPGFWASKLVSSALNLLVGYQNKTLFRKLQTGWYQSKCSMHWFCEHKTSGWLVYSAKKGFPATFSLNQFLEACGQFQHPLSFIELREPNSGFLRLFSGGFLK